MSLLHICSKIFEKLIFDSIYEFLNENNLFNNNQSRFRPNDSCIHQLIDITHNGLLDGLLYKLKSNGIDGNLFKLIKSFLNNRCQRVVLNGQSSVWKSVTAGVPQGLFSMVNLQSGNRLQLVCRKVQFCAHYFSSFTLMTFL